MPNKINGYVSLKQIVNTLLAKKEAPKHRFWKYLILAAEAVRELQLTASMEIINHVILTKDADNDYFELPKGYTDHVVVGARVGSYWRPIAMTENLMGIPNTQGNGQYSSEFDNGQIDVNGNYTSWVNPSGADVPASFSEDDFSSDDFQDADSTTTPTNQNTNPAILTNNSFGVANGLYPFFFSNYVDNWAEMRGRQFGLGDGMRVDNYTINREKGLLIVSKSFPYSELYMQYVSIGKADTMSQIPIEAQSAIEAYVNWKYEENKRNGANVNYLKNEFNEQHRMARARINPITTTEIKRIINQFYGQTQRIG